MRVLLADAHPEVRWALRTAIGELPGLTVVAEVSDCAELMDQARKLKPDVILLEWELLGRSGEESLTALGALNLRSRVIVLSQRPESRQIALAAGAEASISKADAPQELLATLRRLTHD